MRLKLAALVAAALFAAAPVRAQTIAAHTTNGSVVIAAGNTFQTVLAAVAGTTPLRSLTIQNNNATDNCWITIDGGAPTVGKAILLTPGMSYARYYPYVPADAIQATCATTADTLYVDTQ